MKKLIAILLVSVMAFASMAAEAKRMGGGKSVGQQSSNVSKKATPPAQATPPSTAAAPAAAPARPWGAMLGGLAAGLGLAWLASSLGLGAAFGNILMALLIGVAVLAAIVWFMRRRMADSNNLAYQGAGSAPITNEPTRFQGGSMIGSAIGNTGTWTIPVGFDVAGFESAARQNFVLLQAANDTANMTTLESMLTPHMLAEITAQMAERDATVTQRTAVISIESQLLGIEETVTEYVASVKFTGMIQDTVGEPAEPFEEVWNMTKNKTSGGWVVAGIQTGN